REELQGEFAGNPAGLLEYTWQLHQQLSQQEQLLAATHQELARQEQLLAEARAYIAELKRQLFGPKADQLSPEQEEQLRQLTGDLREQAQRPAPLSQEVLELERPPKDQEKLPQEARRRVRHPLPVQLEVQQVVLEPEDKVCGHCRQQGRRIGQETTTEYEYLPAKLICKETVRPKYAHDCSCGPERITIAPLPPRLVPQSKLGLGLAVYLLLSRFDDHVSYYTLERIFLERFGAVIARQQMVQWVEKVAHLLLAIYWLIWEELKAGDYLQIDESPVKVLDPEVKGKAAQGYLWFYSKPGGYVFLKFNQSRGRDGPRERLRGFRGTMQTDGYELY